MEDFVSSEPVSTSWFGWFDSLSYSDCKISDKSNLYDLSALLNADEDYEALDEA